MKQASIFNAALKFVLVVLTAMQVACSSSSSDSGASDATISGTIVAAPVNGADVSVVDAAGNEVVPAVKTDANGKYSLVIPQGSLGQDLIVKSSGGSFTDEATANPGTAGAMYAYTSAGSLSNGSSVSATPGSTIIAELVMTHGKTRAEAEAAFAAAFSYTPDVSVNPADATTAPAADETDAETLAGFRAGAFSQLAMDLGLSQDEQFALFAALAQDLSDDKLDGVDASGAVAIGTTGETLEADIQNRFSMALVNFKNNDNNLTGLDNNEFGDIPFAKVALTANYQIEYKPLSMMAPVNGKDSFQIHVTNRSDGSDAPGLGNMLMPTMYMLGTFKHSTPMPVQAIVDNGAGLYTVTLYYLMPTAMGGYWDLKFMIDGEEVHFYPMVTMAMGDPAQVRLKGVVDLTLGTDLDGDGINDIASLDGIADIVKDMTGIFTSRQYLIFRDDLEENIGGDYTFTMFFSASGNMMNFPQLSTPSTLSSGMGGTPLEVTSIDVRVGVNGGGLVSATPLGDGKWEIAGLALNDGPGEANQLEVELSVNGERKTSDASPGGANAIFQVTPTPSMM